MKRYGKKVKWNAKAVLGLGLALMVILAASQVTTFFRYWIWGPNTGHRIAGLSSGHYERRFPAILRDSATFGYVLMNEGERLTLDYDLTINEGTVSFAVWKWPPFANRPQYVGPRIIEAGGSGRIDFVAQGLGFYRIYMYAHRWQGDVSVDWRASDRGEG
ncbi:hypothetical protein [Pelagibius marinus]|uniref:hypothetical protein n=1 Tax=Pelagibius marinus TaxID=2762760 RepID=UPI001872FBC7|nr:hypothetical protein [Pelagibius marinus]